VTVGSQSVGLDVVRDLFTEHWNRGTLELAAGLQSWVMKLCTMSCMVCYQIMFCYVWLCTLCCVVLCNVTFVMLWYVLLCYVTFGYVSLCCGMLCYVMSCYVMSCYAMPCYAMQCYVMLWYGRMHLCYRIISCRTDRFQRPFKTANQAEAFVAE
jgi:hypothetical protein